MQTTIRRCKIADETNDGEGHGRVSYARLTPIFSTFGLRSNYDDAWHVAFMTAAKAGGTRLTTCTRLGKVQESGPGSYAGIWQEIEMPIERNCQLGDKQSYLMCDFSLPHSVACCLETGQLGQSHRR